MKGYVTSSSLSALNDTTLFSIKKSLDRPEMTITVSVELVQLLREHGNDQVVCHGAEIRSTHVPKNQKDNYQLSVLFHCSIILISTFCFSSGEWADRI